MMNNDTVSVIKTPFTDVKGIIFDMDNTIVRSKINFEMMRAEIFELFLKVKILSKDFPIHEHTVSTMIAEGKKSVIYTDEIGERVWKIAARYEGEGMRNAELEPNAAVVLKYLSQRYRLVLLTNNSYDSAVSVLKNHGIEQYFQLIVGREQISSLKPSSEGVYYILDQYPDIDTKKWISVGDSWIDGKASLDAGVNFIDYQGDWGKMEAENISPVASIKRLEDLTILL